MVQANTQGIKTMNADIERKYRQAIEDFCSGKRAQLHFTVLHASDVLDALYARKKRCQLNWSQIGVLTGYGVQDLPQAESNRYLAQKNAFADPNNPEGAALSSSKA